MRFLTCAHPCVITAALLLTTAARADVVCDDVLGGKISDDVRVPSGAVCVLEGAKVEGNVKVESGGALQTLGAKVSGDVQSEEAAWIELLDGTKVGGNVQIEETSGTPEAGVANAVCGVRIKGDLQLVGNTAPFDLGCEEGNKVSGNLQLDDNEVASAIEGVAIAVTANKVRGNLQLSDNESAAGDFDVSDNRVKQSLQCSDNEPAPVGGGNEVGDADGQCEGLASSGKGGGGKGDGLGDDGECTGTIGKLKVDDLTVPAGAECILEGTRVKGNVQVEPGGALMTSRARVDGNIQAVAASWIVVGDRTKVGGNVQIEETSGTPGADLPNEVCASKIKGDLQVTGNDAPFDLGCDTGNKVGGNLQVQDNRDDVRIRGNRVKGDLQLQDNSSAGEGFDVSENRVKQNLQCVDNTPAPTGGDNKVKGDAEDQCAELTR